MSESGTKLLFALAAKYRAGIAAAEATLDIYIKNPVGIGEHPQHLEEMDKLFEQIVSNQDKLAALEKNYASTN